MPTLVIDGQEFDVEAGKRLILAIEDSGVEILHRCGGYARCTTCRVNFSEGEPNMMTVAEKNRLQQDPSGLFGVVRLACQIECTHDMQVKPIMTMQNSNVSDPGKRPEDEITPTVEWVKRDD